MPSNYTKKIKVRHYIVGEHGNQIFFFFGNFFSYGEMFFQIGEILVSLYFFSCQISKKKTDSFLSSTR